MLLPVLAIVAGFVVLVWGADRFVLGAAATARNVGVSPLIVGLTIVGMGTAAPEMLVSAMAAWQGSTAMGIGNALGSNITNVGLVLGLTALVAPLRVRSEVLGREFPLLLAIMLAGLVLLVDGHLGRLDGVVLVGGMGVLLYWMTRLAVGGRGDPLVDEYQAQLPTAMGTARALLWVLVGLALLLASSRALVWGAVEVARFLHVSELAIGLTIVAIGTSLPELAASVVSALKGEHDIAIGNVLGSNMFNLLAVLGLPGLIRPDAVPEPALKRDYAVMIGLTLVLFALAFGVRGEGRVKRFEGALLLLGFTGYQMLLYVTEGPIVGGAPP